MSKNKHILVVAASSFFRDLERNKLRNCVLILFQYRKHFPDKYFVKCFRALVEYTNVIDIVHTWDINSRYKYNSLLNEYIYLCA